MAATRFFKKQSPATAVVVPGGAKVQFKSLNGVTGYYATNEPGLPAAFEQFMREGRYAITEISFQEFAADYLVKKNSGTPPARPWREEVSPSTFRQAIQPAAVPSAAPVVAVAANPPPPVGMAVADLPPPPATSPTPPDFRPPTGRRPRKKAAIE